MIKTGIGGHNRTSQYNHLRLNHSSSRLLSRSRISNLRRRSLLNTNRRLSLQCNLNSRRFNLTLSHRNLSRSSQSILSSPHLNHSSSRLLSRSRINSLPQLRHSNLSSLCSHLSTSN